MSKFKVGDKVRCVRSEPPHLILEEFYTVLKSRDDLVWLRGSYKPAWEASRFELVEPGPVEPEPVEPAPAQTQTLVIKQATADAVRAEWVKRASQILARYRAALIPPLKDQRGPERIDPMGVIVPSGRMSTEPKSVVLRFGPREHVFTRDVNGWAIEPMLSGPDGFVDYLYTRASVDLYDLRLLALDALGVESAQRTCIRGELARDVEQAEAEAKKLPGPGTACEWGEP